ncbi:hypothetical protein JQ609_18630 [Bradyrhizobium sp. AUGA SZCCT0169]|uniref:hypothetical protein n=1 Tax=Bradyrhizobium sp. AUGA SZCCT0169 TaxID=2807663 RepID=UPI001BA9C9FF|nr:hypothetical protein [Bradyrhizobium sp. AUGA SZCCT0169]MBR1248937.1 hypothetical protein [Bradyrhizobium sp. AUGA SZCCT0169]
MFEIVKVLAIAACAYAGSEVASIQFPELPDCNRTCSELPDGKSLFLDRAHQHQLVIHTVELR